MIEAYRVSWLADYLTQLVESDLRLSNLWLEGEVSNLTRSSAGHVYFTLKDEQAAIRCVMFRRAYGGAPVEAGANVLAHGNVRFYEARGDLQLIVDFVQPAGVGVWQAQFQRLKEQLEAEGLFDPSRKRPLPAFPMRVGVVTSPTGTAFHDISNVAARRWPLAELVLAPTAVQGPGAVPGIIDALAHLNARPDIDLIILARGGGSIEELWAFNEEAVARALYASRLPVVCGVGHEIDTTIADLVADVRAPTPSAAAETALPDRATVFRRLDDLAYTVHVRTSARLSDARTATAHATHRLDRARPDITRVRERIAALALTTHATVERLAVRSSERLDSLALHLRSLDPRRTLARGYAIVQMREDKQAVTSVKQVRGKERLTIHVQDGKFPAQVSKQYGF